MPDFKSHFNIIGIMLEVLYWLAVIAFIWLVSYLAWLLAK